MLRTIQKYRRSFIGIAGVAVIAVVMTGFGLGSVISQREEYAIQVNASHVSHAEFYEQRRQTESRYRRMLGDQYDLLAKQFNMGQQLVDQTVADLLIRDMATQMNLAVSDQESHRMLVESGLFPNGFDRQSYDNYLRQLGMRAVEFESQLRNDALRLEFAGLVQDLGYVSKRELRQQLTREETKYEVDSIEFDPTAFIKEILDPKEEELQKLYTESAVDYELPAQVSYSYMIFDPSNFLDAVEVLLEDVELYYADHELKYQEPEQVKARHIQFTFPKEQDPKKMADLREKADEAREKLLAGQPFDKIAAVYSDDYATREHGGDLGWFGRGKFSQQLEKAAFALKNGGLSEVVTTDYGFEILQVDSYKPARSKELSEVKAEIEKAIREEQSPLYTSSKAREFFDAWQKSGQSLGDYGAANGMMASSVVEKMTADKDPENLTGLTKRVLASSADTNQIVEFGDRTILVQIREYQEPEIPVMGEIRAKLIERYRADRSISFTREKAQGVIDSFTKGVYKDLRAAATAMKLSVNSLKDVTRTKNLTDILLAPEAQEVVFSTFAAMQSPAKVVEHQGRFYLLQVRSITPPTDVQVEAKLAEFGRTRRSQSAELLTRSVINALRARAEVEIDPGILAQG